MKLAPETSGPGRRDFNGGGLGVKPGVGGRRPGLLRILGISDPNGGPVPTRRWKLKPGGNLLVIGNRVPWGRLIERAPMGSLLLRGLQLEGWRRHGSGEASPKTNRAEVSCAPDRTKDKSPADWGAFDGYDG